MSVCKGFFLFIAVCLGCFSMPATFAQKTGGSCFEVRHLDFFGLDRIEEIGWSDREIASLLETDYAEQFDNTRFLIPITVRYLRDFHPACPKQTDPGKFDRLVSLYFKIRLLDASAVASKTATEKLAFIRDDFYSLLRDEKLLPRMRFTMDDGPLYGEIPKPTAKLKILETINAGFGKLQIAASGERIVLLAADRRNRVIWRRVLKGTNPDRYLNNLSFVENPLEKTTLATIVHLSAEGERLTLFLRPDGGFMYYYHSW